MSTEPSEPLTPTDGGQRRWVDDHDRAADDRERTGPHERADGPGPPRDQRPPEWPAGGSPGTRVSADRPGGERPLRDAWAGTTADRPQRADPSVAAAPPGAPPRAPAPSGPSAQPAPAPTTEPVGAPLPEGETAPTPVGTPPTGRRGAVRARRRGRQGRARSVRYVTREVRRIDPIAVGKVSILFYLSMLVVVVTASVLLWLAAASTGVIGNIESFVSSIGFTEFRFLPLQILRGAILGGLVLVVSGTAANVLMAILYNLIAEVMGGLRLTTAEEEGPRRPAV